MPYVKLQTGENYLRASGANTLRVVERRWQLARNPASIQPRQTCTEYRMRDKNRQVPEAIEDMNGKRTTAHTYAYMHRCSSVYLFIYLSILSIYLSICTYISGFFVII